VESPHKIEVVVVAVIAIVTVETAIEMVYLTQVTGVLITLTPDALKKLLHSIVIYGDNSVR